jgi:hypothetical protein
MTKKDEMRRALEADGEKLRALTGEEHGPLQLFTCDICGGEGVVPTGRMSHSVDSATIDPPFEITETCRECNGLGAWIAAAEDRHD